MDTEILKQLVTHILEDNKASDIQALNVASLTDVTDCMIICSALSNRHVDALKDKVVVAVKELGQHPLSIDDNSETGWVLIDLQDVIVHIMLPEVRERYSLEKLWSIAETARSSDTPQ